MSATEFPSPGLVAAAGNLMVDRVSVEVVLLFREAGIPCLLLKGPSIATWLYEPPSDRTYVDSDLLLREDDFPAAERSLRLLGFTPYYCELPYDRPWYARSWVRKKDDALVELHRSLPGVGVEPRSCWETLWERHERAPLVGRTVDVLDPAGRLMHVALHAAHDGGAATKSLTDLERAAEMAPDDLWHDARDLAVRLDATNEFYTGVSMSSRAREIFERLDGTEPVAVSSLSPAGAAVRWFLDLEGTRRRAAYLAHKLFPPDEFLRLWAPVAKKGPAGLLFARLWRPFWVIGRGVRGLVGPRGSRSG